MAKIETLSLEVDGILPDTRVFRERCFLLDGAALYSFKAAPALVPQGRINLHDAQLALREEERAVFITVLAESRIYRLVAESIAESADWAHALRLAVQKQNQDHKVLKMGYLKKSVLGGWGAARRQWAAPVAANGEVDATCEAALAKGGADFYVVGQLGEPGGVACELQITRSGARLRCTQGALGLLALTGHGDGVRRLPFRTSGGVTLGDGAASVVLPTALLQARLTGADGATAVVQAGSPFVRDLIVSTARAFA